MQLGLVTYMWGAEWDVPTIIKNCQATGFRGVELRSGHKHGVELPLHVTQRIEVRRRFADSQVTLIGIGSSCEYHSPDPAQLKKNIEDTKAYIRLSHDVGGTGVKVRPNKLPPGVPVEKTLEQIGRALDQVASYGEGYGIQIRLEIHGPGTSEIPNVKKIMDAAPSSNARLCWNCNPEDLQGRGLTANFNLLKNRLGDTVHVHDLISSYPWRDFFALLRKENYQGWTLLEENSPTADPLRVMKYYRLLWQTMAG